MSKEEFLKKVKYKSSISDDEIAEKGTKEVFHLLSSRITKDEAKDAGSQMEGSLKDWWDGKNWTRKISQITNKDDYTYKTREELYDLLRDEMKKKGYNIDEELFITSVLHTLKEQLTEGEISHIKSQLPPDIALLLQDS